MLAQVISFRFAPAGDIVSQIPVESQNLSLSRQLHRKDGPSVPAFRPYASSMKLYDLLCDGKSQTGAAVLCAPGVIQPAEFLKDRLQSVGRDGLSAVFK